MQVVATDSATFMNTTQGTGDFDAQLVIHNSSVMDTDSMFLYYAKVRYDFKDSHFTRGDEMDRLVTEARQSPDDTLRVADYARVSSIINEDAYAVYILMDINTIAYKKDIKGVKADMAKYYRVSEWSY
jgi:ABC-type transport system substrate-binding protein